MLFNPSNPRVFRSPPFKAGVFPFETVSTPIPLISGRKVPQFGRLVTSFDSIVPGPIVRDQPVRNKPFVSSPGQSSPTNATVGYPGLQEPAASTLSSSSPAQVTGKHYSNSIFYNQQEPFDYGYGSAPYWRFHQWSQNLPEYFILDAQLLSTYSVFHAADAGYPSEPGSQPDRYIPVPFTAGGKFLMRRAEGYLFRSDASTSEPVSNFTSRTGSGYFAAADPDSPIGASWVPVYDYGLQGFPSIENTWCLSFRPMLLSGFSQVSADAAEITPFSWNISCVSYSSIQTITFIEFSPFPTGGSVQFRYVNGSDTYFTQTVSIPNTGNPSTDAETLRQRLQAAFVAGGYSTSEVLTISVGSAWLYQANIIGPHFGQLQIKDSSLLVGGNVRVYTDTEFGFLGLSGDVHYFTPTYGFRQPNRYISFTPDPLFPLETVEVLNEVDTVTCKDTRDIGNFDSSYYQDQPYGESRSSQGLSYGSIDPKKVNSFTLRTLMIDAQLNSDTRLYDFPGWPLPVPEFFDGNGAIHISRSVVTITPVYL